jgi:hypothetical protein
LVRAHNEVHPAMPLRLKQFLPAAASHKMNINKEKKICIKFVELSPSRVDIVELSLSRVDTNFHQAH